MLASLPPVVNLRINMSSPESSPSLDGFAIEMADAMLPASDLEGELFSLPQDSGATVVSASSDDVAPAASLRPRCRKPRKASASAMMLARSPAMSEAVAQMTTQPVPEFLCHLFTMLREPSYAGLISWEVPSEDEPESTGGGSAGIGKIVVHHPEALQDTVLGKYYRHSKYSSFQRQLNYFGFKKRLHAGKKGKLSPCSYIHELLSEDVASLFSLKRRPPAKKRVTHGTDDDCDASLSSIEEPATSTTRSGRVSKKRRISAVKANKKQKKSKKDKRSRRGRNGKQQIVVSSVPMKVQDEEYAAPYLAGSATVVSSANSSVAAPTHVRQISESSMAPAPRPAYKASLAVAQPTLLEMLSTSLPPSDVLFNDHVDFDSLNHDGAGMYVADDGSYRHDVDSSLVDLAMLY